MDLKIDNTVKLMIASFFIVFALVAAFLLGPQRLLELAQSNVSTLIMGIIIGLVIMYLLLQAGKEEITPMTATETFKRYVIACQEELKLPIIEGQVQFDATQGDYMQVGKYLIYRGKMYTVDNELVTKTIIIDATMRDPSREKSPQIAKLDYRLNDDEVLKLLAKLTTPAATAQAIESLKKDMQTAQEVKKISEEI